MRLASSVYEVDIRHARLAPRAHKFRHLHYMFYLDLDELERLPELFLFRHRWLFSFDESDYMLERPSGGSLKKRVELYLQGSGIYGRDLHKVMLLTNVRLFTYAFNPVSFFFCFDQQLRPIACVAEVGNTFSEKKIFALQELSADGRTFCGNRPKQFYISPFTHVTDVLDFQLEIPGDKLNLRINTVREAEVVVRATMSGSRRELSDRQLWLLLLKYPFATLQVIAAIHTQALILWLKRVPAIRKDATAHLETNTHIKGVTR